MTSARALTMLRALVPIALAILFLGGSLLRDGRSFAVAVATFPWAPVLLLLASLALAAVAARPGMRWQRPVALGLIVALVVPAVALQASFLGAHARLAGVESATMRFLAAHPLPEGAQLYASTEPYAGGAVELTPEVGEPFTFAMEGKTWFFMIDHAPTQKRAHPITYAFLSDQVRTVEGSWFVTIDDADGWDLVAELRVNGVLVGVISPRPPEAALELPDVTEPVAALGRALEHGSVAAAAGRREALLVDGGDAWIDPSKFSGLPTPWLLKILDETFLRIQMAREADALARLLPDFGYKTSRLSGLASRGQATPKPDAIGREIARLTSEMQSGEELYLHFNSHGIPEGLVLYDKGFRPHLLTYEQLNSMLEPAVAKGLKVTVGLDACHSGAAHAKLKGVEVHTATSSDGTAPGGVGADVSYTESVLEKMRDPFTLLVDDPVKEALAHADAQHADNGAGIADKIRTGVAPLRGGEVGSVTTPPPTPTPTPTPVPTADLAGVLSDIREQWAEQHPGVTMGAPTCTPSGAVPIPAQVSCTYVDSNKNAGVIALELGARGAFSWRSETTALHLDGLLAVASSQFRDRVGRSMQGIACDKRGLIPVKTSVSCSYTDPLAGRGRLTITIAADAGWKWEAKPEAAAATTAPPQQITTAAPAATTAPPRTAAFSPSGSVTSTACTLLRTQPDQGYGVTHYYSAAVSGTARGMVGTSFEVGGVEPVCAAWTGCQRAQGQPETTSWTWTTSATVQAGWAYSGLSQGELNIWSPGASPSRFYLVDHDTKLCP